MPTGDSPPAPIHYERVDFDLSAHNAAADAAGRNLDLNVISTAPCAAPAQDGLADAIVVCGSRSAKSYRLPPLAAGIDPGGLLGRAELRLGDHATVGLRAEGVAVGNAISNRMMVTYSLKF